MGSTRFINTPEASLLIEYYYDHPVRKKDLYGFEQLRKSLMLTVTLSRRKEKFLGNMIFVDCLASILSGDNKAFNDTLQSYRKTLFPWLEDKKIDIVEIFNNYQAEKKNNPGLKLSEYVIGKAREGKI